jgi:hypothetical protein
MHIDMQLLEAALVAAASVGLDGEIATSKWECLVARC